MEGRGLDCRTGVGKRGTGDYAAPLGPYWTRERKRGEREIEREEAGIRFGTAIQCFQIDMSIGPRACGCFWADWLCQ